jgi:hypothetical protein
MSIRRVYYCDWRECNHHVPAHAGRPPLFLTVSESAGGALHFCTWDCVLKYAAEKPPCETVPLAATD